MSPKMKTRDIKMRSCRKNKTKETAPINSPPKMTKPKRRIIEKIPKDKRSIKSAPSASTASCVSTEGNKNAEMRSCRKNKTKETAPIKSPLKMTKPKRRIMQKTSKDNDAKLKENLPGVRNTITGEPGEKYAKYFDMSIPGLSDSDEEPEEIVRADRRGRKIAEERKNAERERKNAEKERKKAEKERKKAEKAAKEREKELIKAEREREKKLKKAERECKKEERMMSSMMKYSLNAYKYSVDYENLKKKKFNTGFIHQTPRRHEIEIFTAEENNDPKWKLPAVKNTITGEPGESHAKYNDIFMSLPGFSDSDEEPEEIVKTKGKRGRKKAVGYKGVPLPDECLVTNYETLLYSPGCSK